MLNVALKVDNTDLRGELIVNVVEASPNIAHHFIEFQMTKIELELIKIKYVSLAFNRALSKILEKNHDQNKRKGGDTNASS